MSDKTPEEQVKELASRIDEKIEEANKAAIEAAEMKGEEAAKSLTEKQKELHGEIEELASKHEDALKEIDKLKGEMEKAGSFGNPVNAYNKALKDNEESLKAMTKKDRSRSALITMKSDDFFQEKATMTTGGSLQDRRVIPFDRVVETPVYDPEERPLRDFFTVGSTSADSVEWPIEQVPGSSPLESYDYDNNAAAVDSDSAAQKPESEFQWDLETRTVRDIAHTARLHKNLMNDLPLLQTYLPTRLRDGLYREESRQILDGADGSQEIIGLTQTGSHVDFDVASFQSAVVNNGKTLAEANYIDILGYAKTQLRLNNYSGTLILMNPEDFYSFMFSVDNDGDYHMNNPVWLYVAAQIQQSNYVDQDEFLVIDSNRSNFLLQRENVTIEFSYEDRDNFVKNLVTIRAEERIVQVTERPNGIVYGGFAAAVAT